MAMDYESTIMPKHLSTWYGCSKPYASITTPGVSDHPLPSNYSTRLSKLKTPPPPCCMSALHKGQPQLTIFIHCFDHEAGEPAFCKTIAYLSGDFCQCNTYRLSPMLMGGGGVNPEVERGRGVKRNFGGHAHSPALVACSYWSKIK